MWWVILAVFLVALVVLSSINFLASLDRSKAVLESTEVPSLSELSRLSKRIDKANRIEGRGRIVGVVVNPPDGVTVEEMFDENGFKVSESGVNGGSIPAPIGVPVIKTNLIRKGRIFPIFDGNVDKFDVFRPLDIDYKRPDAGDMFMDYRPRVIPKIKPGS